VPVPAAAVGWVAVLPEVGDAGREVPLLPADDVDEGVEWLVSAMRESPPPHALSEPHSMAAIRHAAWNDRRIGRLVEPAAASADVIGESHGRRAPGLLFVVMLLPIRSDSMTCLAILKIVTAGSDEFFASRKADQAEMPVCKTNRASIQYLCDS
jgi:hypothetical protein